MKVFFITYGGGHATMVAPVAKKLLEKGHQVEILGLTTAGNILSRENLHYHKITDFVDINSNIDFFGRMLAARHHTENKGILLSESISYLGVSFYELVNDVGLEMANRMYQDFGLNAFCPTTFMEKVIKFVAPDIVAATTSPRMEMAALRAAKALGIKSVCMVDMFGILEIDWLKRDDNGHILTVYSEKVAKRLIKAGRKKESIFITGNPAFDRILAIDVSILSGRFRDTKNIPKNNKIILWAEQPEPNVQLPRYVRNYIASLCEQHDNWTCVVRLHPSSTDSTKEIIPYSAIQSHSFESLDDAIAAADIVITFTSTVAMEALLLGKPVIILAVSAYSHLVDYSEEDGALIINSPDEIEGAINCLLGDSKKAEKLKMARENLLIKNGAAAEVVALLDNYYNSKV